VLDGKRQEALDLVAGENIDHLVEDGRGGYEREAPPVNGAQNPTRGPARCKQGSDEDVGVEDRAGPGGHGWSASTLAGAAVSNGADGLHDGIFNGGGRYLGRATSTLDGPDRGPWNLLALREHHPRQQLGLFADGEILYPSGQFHGFRGRHVGLRHGSTVPVSGGGVSGWPSPDALGLREWPLSMGMGE
jgi:hypothetical protein